MDSLLDLVEAEHAHESTDTATPGHASLVLEQPPLRWKRNDKILSKDASLAASAADGLRSNHWHSKRPTSGLSSFLHPEDMIVGCSTGLGHGNSCVKWQGRQMRRR